MIRSIRRDVPREPLAGSAHLPKSTTPSTRPPSVARADHPATSRPAPAERATLAAGAGGPTLPVESVLVDRKRGTMMVRAEKALAPAQPAPALYGEQGYPDWRSVKQGSVDDCWFVSAAISVARDDPKRIQDLITDHGDGTYTVQFPQVANGIRVKAPAPNEGFSSSNGNWMGVLEKAYGTHLANEGPKVQVRPPGLSDKVAWEPPKRGAAGPLGKEYPKYYANAQTPQQAMDGPNNFGYKIGTPWGGLMPFYSSGERKATLFIPPGIAGEAAAPIIRKNVGNYLEWGTQNGSPVTAGTFIQKLGGVSHPELKAAHVYAVTDFRKDPHNYGSSTVELRDPAGKTVNLPLDDFIANFGAVGAGNVPGISPDRKKSVAGFYAEMFGRDANDAEIALHARTNIPLPQLRSSFAQTPEGIAAIHGVYQELLGRRAEPGGLQNAMTFLANGGTLAQLRAGIRASPEYRQKR